MQANEIHEKIIGLLEEKGPSLPIQVAKELDMSSLFVSAFLSELADSKRVKITNLKVGGSPLYFLDGQEEKLEDYYKFMHPREAEVFLLLKERKVLKDDEQEPAARVALRSLRDFAVGFKINDDIYWRYMLIPEIEVKELLDGTKEKVVKKKTEKISSSPQESSILDGSQNSKRILKSKDDEENSERDKNSESKFEEKKEVISITKEDKIKTGFKNPVVISKKIGRKKPKSEFVLKVINFLRENGLQVVEEKDYKMKEYNCVVRIKSELGQIDFLTQAKDKKTVSESDLKKLLSNAQSIPIPALMVYTGEISKKAKEFFDRYSSVLKVKKII